MNAYEFVEREEKVYYCYKMNTPGKLYGLQEVWFNVSKSGCGHYFGIDVDGVKKWVSVAIKTANGKRYCEDFRAMKVNANGVLTVNEKGYVTFTIIDLNNFEEI